MAKTKAERLAVEAAAGLLSDEDFGLGLCHAGFAMTSLPHRRIEETRWKRNGGEGGSVSLLVESGSTLDDDGFERPVGIPYGSVARLILFYLQTQAIRTRSREIELGGSMHQWLGSMGMASGGENYRMVREQAWRISRCRLTFRRRRDGMELARNAAFVVDSILPMDLTGRPMPLQQTRVRLEETFYLSLLEHPLPFRRAAIKPLIESPMALDVYVWLAYRLHALKGDTPVPWGALQEQFGHGFARPRALKPHLLRALELAKAVYPEARVVVVDEGLVLRPSPPAVPRSEAANLLGYN